MRLIADSGSTSVDWRILWEDRAPEQVISGGINPVYQGESDICEIIRASVGFCAGSVDEVWFMVQALSLRNIGGVCPLQSILCFLLQSFISFQILQVRQLPFLEIRKELLQF